MARLSFALFNRRCQPPSQQAHTGYEIVERDKAFLLPWGSARPTVQEDALVPWFVGARVTTQNRSTRPAWSALCIAILYLFGLGCGPAGGPRFPQRRAPTPIRQRGALRPKPAAKQSFPSDPLLQSLVDAGARIVRQHREFSEVYTLVGFHARRIEPSALRRVARLRRPVVVALENCDVSAAALAELRGTTVRLRVEHSNCEVTSATLAPLDGAGSVESLIFKNTTVDDEAFSRIKSMPGLTRLFLDGANVDGSGLGFLSNCTKLKMLSARSTRLSDEALAQIIRTQEITELELVATMVSDEGLKSIARCSTIERLGVGGCDITDAGAKQLSTLTTLRSLDVSGTKISNAGVRHLRALRRLEILGLNGTKITNGCLPDLAALSHLNYVGIQNTAITAEAVKATLPNPSVAVGPGPVTVRLGN